MTDELSDIRIIRYNPKDAIFPNQNIQYKYLFKVSLIGDASVGKTSILLKFIEDTFNESLSSTIGVDFKIISFDLGDNTYAKMQIWDTCGAERFKSMTSSFIKSCPTFILVFDITKKESFLNLDNWIKTIKENSEPKMLCLVGNKSDLIKQRQVTEEDILILSKEYGFTYIETSAKDGTNIEKIFIEVIKILYHDAVKNAVIGQINNNAFEVEGFKDLKENEIEEKKDKEDKCPC